ncbi:hypothetical protein CWC05_12165 [Pseudoalteromonas ruthenica]|uniref:Uncharacterized protein n=1 Tax=Pseudoalteromonas ruthenica TaxID=151081 RepID=A0A5S3Z3B5_9GAMM|nr:hypothetical protein [Pseudoalteromonas ruthenica]TMP86764.1 hypothetical protein CWC05_12165 [Pseudoalteromonas ruthenica]
MKNSRIKIGIVPTELGGMDIRALTYLILFQNTIQTSFEFQFMPFDSEHRLFKLLNSKTPVGRSEVTAEADKFIENYDEWLRSKAAGYRITPSYPDGIIFLSICRFSDNYFATGGNGWDIIALGNWERIMAPPSIVEFFLTLVLRASIDVACGQNFPARHQSLKGCVFDFSATISNARYSVLTGYLCQTCCKKISSERSEQVAEDAKMLFSKQWLGEAMQPTTVSNIVKKLGYDLFHTSGIKPTLGERLLATAEKEAVANIIKLIGTIFLAGLLLWLGLKQ